MRRWPSSRTRRSERPWRWPLAARQSALSGGTHWTGQRSPRLTAPWPRQREGARSSVRTPRGASRACSSSVTCLFSESASAGARGTTPPCMTLSPPCLRGPGWSLTLSWLPSSYWLSTRSSAAAGTGPRLTALLPGYMESLMESLWIRRGRRTSSRLSGHAPTPPRTTSQMPRRPAWAGRGRTGRGGRSPRSPRSPRNPRSP
mmetsp:Transcript_49690/g.132986  ORF Transcript_49690/g.132986 Transcript_49690/m.132986 type:complete len:202 (-) Transcript_49690:1354-1959(-)